LLGLHAIAFDETFPIFAATKNPNNAGLGLEARSIATILSSMGLVVLLTLLWGYPWLNKRISTLKLCQAMAVLLTLVYPFFPILPELNSSMRIMSVMGLLILRFVANAISFTSLNILVRNEYYTDYR
jgi:hypothetical protein